MGLARLRAVADGTFVATSSKYTTTTTVIVSRDEAFVVDPAWTPGELDGLVADLQSLGLQVAAGFASHAHQDHVLWHPGLGDVPRYASATTIEKTAEWRDELIEHLGADLTPELLDVFAQLTPMADDTLVIDGFAPIRVVTHDGHAPGHSALFVEPSAVLVAGDMLSDIELPLPFFPDDLPAYLVALDLLAPLVRQAAVLIPGHGHVTNDPMARLDADRFYLDRVIHTGDADDPRRGEPGMEENHQQIVALARQLNG